MIRCTACQTANVDTSRFCDECGTMLAAAPAAETPSFAAYVPPASGDSFSRASNDTSIGIPPLIFGEQPKSKQGIEDRTRAGSHSTLVIERGDAPGTEFRLINDESTLGRWDADNGVFPDVDLDAHDSDAKVSRRHARIVRNNGSYYIEDLGSTNGTYVNRGRRLLPGNAQVLSDGDEIIVGKTFLRFKIGR